MKRAWLSWLLLVGALCSLASPVAAQTFGSGPYSGPGSAPGVSARLSEPATEWTGRRGAPSRPAEPLPPDAQQIVNQLQEREAAIQARAAAEVEAARSEVLPQLKALQDRYTKAGDLDHAVAIRDRIRALEAATAAQSSRAPELYQFRGQIGKALTFRVKGSNSGIVWGSDIYTDDSDVGTAAVHAGLLKVGEIRSVTVTIVEGQSAYSGSTRNGITTSSYPNWGGSFRFGANVYSRPLTSSAQAPETLYGVGRIGEMLAYNLTGGTSGYVWGTGPYTDDSNLAAAAVHAGVIDPGQTGQVVFKIVEGQSDYAGSSRNGVESRPYSRWERSVAVVSGPKQNLKYQVTIEPNGKPDPGNLMEYRERVGQTFVFLVTGSNNGSVYGTDVYTDDSSLATAVVHAGVLKVGETGLVKVTIVSGAQKHPSSSRNGITSHNWESWYTSYRVERVQPPASIDVPTKPAATPSFRPYGRSGLSSSEDE